MRVGSESRRAVGIAGLAVAALSIAGCTSADDPASDRIDAITSPATTSLPAVEQTSVAGSAPAATYLVVPGDSLSGIASSSGISLDALLAANSWPDGAAHVIHPGDLVTLPPGATQPGPREPSTSSSESAGSDDTASASDVEVGGYRIVASDALLGLGADGVSDSIDDPLSDGVYYADTYEATADGSAVRFHLARFSTAQACVAALDTVPGETVDPFPCLGGIVDTTATAVVTMALDDDMRVVLVSADYQYLEVSAREFGRLLRGEPPAADAPAWFEYQPYWAAMVEVADGRVVGANQRPSS